MKPTTFTQAAVPLKLTQVLLPSQLSGVALRGSSQLSASSSLQGQSRKSLLKALKSP